MSDRTVIQTDAAPAPIGPYSQAIKTGSLLFLAGQVGLDPRTGKFAGSDAATQCEQILRNIEAILNYAGMTMGHIVRCNVYVADLNDMPAINKVYARHFLYQPPVRTTVQVAALPGGARLEIEVTATLPSASSSADRLG